MKPQALMVYLYLRCTYVNEGEEKSGDGGCWRGGSRDAVFVYIYCVSQESWKLK